MTLQKKINKQITFLYNQYFIKYYYMNTYEYDEQISCARCHRREYTDTRSSQSDPVVHNPSTERPCIKNIQIYFLAKIFKFHYYH